MENDEPAECIVRRIVQASAELSAEISSRPPTLAGKNVEYAIDSMMDALDEWRRERR